MQTEHNRIEFSRPDSRERGSTMLEFAALLPVVMTILVSVIEIGNAVNQYLQISRISYEGARFGAAIAGLETGTYQHSSTAQSVRLQRTLQTRVLTLLDDYGYDTSQALLTTAREDVLGGGTFDAVSVRVSIPVRPILFRQYSSIQFNINSSAPYLFADDEI